MTSTRDPSFDEVRTYAFSALNRVVHGIGALAELPALVESLADSSGAVVVATTRSVLDRTDLVDQVSALLRHRRVVVAEPIRAHTPEPDVIALESAIHRVDAGCVIGVGGSSVSDGVKIASLRARGGTAHTVATNGVAVVSPVGPEQAVPFVMVPTTLSVGEFTNGAGTVPAGGTAKTVVIDDRSTAKVVLFDPVVTLSTPRELWLSSGVKAVDHAAEALWSDTPHPYADALATAALAELLPALELSARDPEDLSARLRCQVAAWMSISTILNTGMRLSHVLEHSIGAYWNLGHGITSCVALPTVMESLAADDPARVALVARALGAHDHGGDAETAKEGAELLRAWIARLGLPARLGDVVPDRTGFPVVAEQAAAELAFFGRPYGGGPAGIAALLDRMW